jgi:hypothetical protein
MIHDPKLTDLLSTFPATRFVGRVFRATSLTADAMAPSTTGGRWAPPPDGGAGVPVLYTSQEWEGALAEVASYLVLQSPVPSKKLRVHRLRVSTAKTITLTRENLLQLGVDFTRYGERDYDVTQRIGAAVNFLEFDGLIAPSARWKCDNLIIFAQNHALVENLEVEHADEVDWRAWARSVGLM